MGEVKPPEPKCGLDIDIHFVRSPDCGQPDIARLTQTKSKDCLGSKRNRSMSTHEECTFITDGWIRSRAVTFRPGPFSEFNAWAAWDGAVHECEGLHFWYMS